MNRKISILLCLIMFAMLLPSCRNDEGTTGAMGSRYWSAFPPLAAGMMNTDALEVASWDSGRLEATSYETMAETETGYYLVYMNHLFYADRDNLSNWVPVCNAPNCGHTIDERCAAIVLSERIVVKNDRIFTLVNSGTYPEIHTGKEAVVVMSMAADGEDKRLEYVLEEGVYSGSAGIAALLYSNQMLYNAVELLPDGTATGHLYRVTDAGVEKVTTAENFAQQLIVSTPTNIVHGVHLFSTTLLDGTGKKFYYYENDALKALDITLLPGTGGYLSGQTLRYFKANDGYYDCDMETGENTYLAPARLENSRSRLLLPNCIIETTLIGSNSAIGNTTVQNHKMELYDGITWHRVKLPKELHVPDENIHISIMGVSSDSVFIACYDKREDAGNDMSFDLYRILLGTENLIMEFCGTIQIPGANDR